MHSLLLDIGRATDVKIRKYVWMGGRMDGC